MVGERKIAKGTLMLSPAGRDLIIKFETGGEAYYNKFLRRPTVPPGSSGVTILCGCDLGYEPAELVKKMIWDYVTEVDFDLLLGALGLIKQRASAYLPKISHLSFEWHKALQVLDDFTIPLEYEKAKAAFPGFESLHPDAQAALISVGFNRGFAMAGDSRREMRAIRDFVPKQAYSAIATQILAMRRLWKDTAIEAGMFARREAEAKLINNCSA